ncbi:MAG: DUF805 domain-containing protein [Pseudomonadota bacterium]
MSDTYPASTADLFKADNGREIHEPKLFSLRGRIGRLRFVTFYNLASLALTGAAFSLAQVWETYSSAFNFFNTAFYLAAAAFVLVITKRRLHDLNESAWWCLLFFIPVVHFLFNLWLVLSAGSKDGNCYGPRPSANTGLIGFGAWALPVLVWALYITAKTYPVSGLRLFI